MVFAKIRSKYIAKYKPVVYKIWMSNKRSYINVYVWPSVKKMQDGAAIYTRKFYACYIPYTFCLSRTNRFLGEMHFSKTRCKVGTVAHEILHAIFDYTHKKNRIPDVARYEKLCEDLCWENGELNTAFWNGWYAREKTIQALK